MRREVMTVPGKRGTVHVCTYKGFEVRYSPGEERFEVTVGADLSAKTLAALKPKIDAVARVEYEPVPAIIVGEDRGYSGPSHTAKLKNISIVAPDVVDNWHSESHPTYRRELEVWIKDGATRKKVSPKDLLEASDECVEKIEAWRALEREAEAARKRADAAWKALPRAAMPKPKTNPEVK